MGNHFVGYDNLIPLIAPVAGTTGTLTSGYMDLRGAQNASFLIMFGVIESTTATNYLWIKCEGATDAASGTEAEIDFNYRLSGIVTANTWGPITSAAAAVGFIEAIPALDNNMVWIDLDPDALAANDYRYVRFVAAPEDSLDTYVVAAIGIIESRYKQTTHLSATAAASV